MSVEVLVVLAAAAVLVPKPLDFLNFLVALEQAVKVTLVVLVPQLVRLLVLAVAEVLRRLVEMPRKTEAEPEGQVSVRPLPVLRWLVVAALVAAA
jgi:hypothetical protein